ncbi:hypothetical protein [Aeromicrobium sp. 179-A 4D2 NHS]|uniref:hypothetical protein n=1 Tax=Aeromicrobium sp. 179-A 4D2 NHS TaxID=3142375 RepID=UPI0039A23D97
MAEAQASHGRKDMDVRATDQTANQRKTDQWEGHEGEPTKRAGKVLTALLVIVAIGWIVAMVQILRLPVQEVRVTAESAIWMAVALSCGVSTFILGIWKLHRV